MSKFHSPWRATARRASSKRGRPPTPAQYREAHPAPRGGAGEHFPKWVSSRQAQNHLSFNDFVALFPEVTKRLADDPRYFPDRGVFKKVRSRGSPRWGHI